MAFLETKNLSYYYQDGEYKRYILNDISFEFEKGVFYTISGQSGSGKTTFLSLISALDIAQSGQIFLNKVEIQSIGYEKYRRNHVGIIFQSYNLIPYLTALENITLAMEITDNKIEEDYKIKAYTLLSDMGIDEVKAKRFPNQLSGGEQQRIAIARALATNTDLILADEPTGNLDEEVSLDIVEIFRKLAHEQNKCVIVVTHSKEVAALSDVKLNLQKGKLQIAE